MQSTLSIILADDHSLMRYGMTSFLERRGYQVIGQASSYEEVPVLLEETEPDVLVCDCRMPGDAPLNFLLKFKQQYPAIKIMFVSGMESSMLFEQLLQANVDGLVSKKGGPEEIEEALQALQVGEQFVSPSIADLVETSPKILTNREYQVLEMIVQGLSNRLIAERLHKSESTINIHRVSIMRKLGVHSVVDLVHYVRDNGLNDS